MGHPLSCFFHPKKPHHSQQDHTQKLFVAVRAGDLHKIKHYLRKGANINGRDRMIDSTILRSSIAQGSLSIFQYLIDNGANVNDIDSDGNTVLLAAICDGKMDFIKSLLNAGADPYHKNYHGVSPYAFATWKNNPYILQLLDSAKKLEAPVLTQTRRMP